MLRGIVVCCGGSFQRPCRGVKTNKRILRVWNECKEASIGAFFLTFEQQSIPDSYENRENCSSYEGFNAIKGQQADFWR